MELGNAHQTKSKSKPYNVLEKYVKKPPSKYITAYCVKFWCHLAIIGVPQGEQEILRSPKGLTGRWNRWEMYSN